MPFATLDEQVSYSNDRAARISRRDRDIAEDYPPAGDLDARKACERDFRLFCEWYFPTAFPLAWSEDHLKAIARMQAMVLDGGLFAMALPRGSGKTTLCVRGAIWALLYGHRRFVCLVAATEGLAEKLLEHFKVELTYNEALIRDFRQVCYPLVRLENNGRKAIGQLFDGEQTRIGWGSDRLTLPTMPDSACDGANVSGSTISVAGLTGSLRGQSSTLASGEIIRPELVLLDDPQTRESAMSPSQSATREAIIKGDVLGMAGPGKRIAALMTMTVIRKDDMADLMLDRKRNPEWNGQKSKMLYAFPKAEKLWEEYRRIRAEDLEADRGTKGATEYYRANRAAMDEGAQVAWPARYYEDELGPVQHAMNIRLFNEAAFFAEYQNDPLPILGIQSDDLTADQIAGKVNGLPRGLVPLGCNHVTAFIDVQATLLYYCVVAWEDDFTGCVIDYDAFPKQNTAYFTLRDAKIRLDSVVRNAGMEGQVRGGLKLLTDLLLAQDYLREDGDPVRIDRCLIDSAWGTTTDLVYEFCRQSSHAAKIYPSRGLGIGAGSQPMNEYKKRPGDRLGLNWRITRVTEVRGARKALYDANYWKSFVYSRFAVALGDRGCLSLWGNKPDDHRCFADHLLAEFRVRTQGRGREVDEWKQRPDRKDNHWFDCLAGCAVAAAVQGVTLPENKPVRARAETARGKSFSQQYYERWGYKDAQQY